MLIVDIAETKESEGQGTDPWRREVFFVRFLFSDVDIQLSVDMIIFGPVCLNN